MRFFGLMEEHECVNCENVIACEHEKLTRDYVLNGNEENMGGKVADWYGRIK